jgi:uncharacterized protein (TIGR02147 family)
MSPVLKAIFEYSDYRALLRDYFQEQKRAKRSFSHRYFAQLAGFSSSGFLAHVMEGKRNLTEESVRKLSKALGLRAKAAAYLENLVLCNQAKTIEEKTQRLRALEKMRRQSPAHRLDADQAAVYFREWYYPALRELAVHADWKGNYGRLGGMLYPPLSADKTEKALRVLLDLGLVKREPDGKFLQTSETVTTEGLPPSLRRSFRMAMMMKAMESLDSLGPQSRHVSGVTVGMSEKTYRQVSSWMDELRAKILEAASQDEHVERVYHYNFQGFPLTSILKPVHSKRRGEA